MLDAETLRLQGRLSRGARIRLSADNNSWRKWWTVQAAGSRYAIVTQQAPFRPKGDYIYSILDFETGIRGPSDLIGNGWDVSQYPSAEIGWRLLHLALLSGRRQITTRNRVSFSIVDVRLACSRCGDVAVPEDHCYVEPLEEGNFCHSCAIETDALFGGRHVRVASGAFRLSATIIEYAGAGHWNVRLEMDGSEWSVPRERISARPSDEVAAEGAWNSPAGRLARQAKEQRQPWEQ